MRDANDFDAFYTTSSRRVLGQLFAMTGDLGEAEDAVQEAYARAWQSWSRVGALADPEAWVRTVAYRVWISAWRKARNRLSAHRRDAPAVSEAAAEAVPDRLAVVAALRRIPPPQRQVIVLHYLVGLGVEEVARQAGISPGTVKSRLSRGRKALAPHVAEFSGRGRPDPDSGPQRPRSAPVAAPADPSPRLFGRMEDRHV